MIRFNSDFQENFIAVVRKYMQLRGGLTQKELADQLKIAAATVSRFFALKSTNIDEQLVANIIATLNIPLHEIIDGVDEESTDTFKRLVQFYKEQKLIADQNQEESRGPETKTKTNATINVGGKRQQMPFGETTTGVTRSELSMREKLETLSPRQKAYLNDFLDLDVDDRDLIVDLGDAIFRYFRQRNIQF
jgi:transcriptional regulator with XRE-family HTH domain